MERTISYLKTKINHPSFWQWFFLIAIIIIFHASHPLNSDEGVVLDGAWNLINGKIPYRDFFEFIPPGSFYFIFVVWKLFGVSYLIAKIASMIALLAGSICLHKIAKQFTQNKTLAYLPALFFILSSAGWPIINHNVYNAVILIWASYFFLRAIGTKNFVNYFWSGLLMGISFLFLQQKSALVFLALLLFIVTDYFVSVANKKNQFKQLTKNIFLFTIGFILPCLWLLHWPISTIWIALYEFPAHHYLATNSVSLSLFLLFIICFAIVFASIKNKTREIYFLFTIQSSLLLASLSRPDYSHLTQSYFLFYVLAIIIINQLNKKERTNYLYQYISITALFIIVLVIWSNINAKLFSTTPFYSISRASIFTEIKLECHSPYFYAGPFLPGMYFETKKLNTTFYPILITGQQTEEQFKLGKKQLEQNKPDCVALNYHMSALNTYNINNPVDELITNNYHKIYTQGDLILYKINQ